MLGPRRRCAGLDRGAPLNRPVHVFNIDIRDNHEEALIGGGAILELANALIYSSATNTQVPLPLDRAAYADLLDRLRRSVAPTPV